MIGELATFILPCLLRDNESANQHNTPKLRKLTNFFLENTVSTFIHNALYAEILELRC
jgi:hypothetical protein